MQPNGTRRDAALAEPEPADDLAQARSRTPAGGLGEVRIGARLKHARLLKGQTLRELADELGCSESMLSKVENDRLTPSLAFLHRLAQALGTSMAQLFAENEALSGPVHHFPADRRARIVEETGAGGDAASFERIIPVERSGLLQANILNIPPRTRSDGNVEHVGEELGYLIEGELEVIVDGVSYAMRPGDLLFFPSSLPHGYHNRGDSPVRILWVNTPPSL